MVYNHWCILDIIDRKSPCSFTNKEFGEILRIPPETARRIVYTLRDRGYIISEVYYRDHQTRRRLMITPQGKRVRYANQDLKYKTRREWK